MSPTASRTRLETRPIGDPGRVVLIKNVAQSAYYPQPVKSDGWFWISGPIVLPPEAAAATPLALALRTLGSHQRSGRLGFCRGSSSAGYR